ncbi:MAG: pyridoxal-phosphate dependent enzyme [Thermoplasmataceae archaeon]
MKAVCIKCGRQRTSHDLFCSCGSVFDLKPDFKYRSEMQENFPYIKDWISLGEVQTPMVQAGDFSMKLDYYHPTFSYKDRGSRTLVSYLKTFLPEGSEISEDSSGNAGASIAAYGKRAGYRVNIFTSVNAAPGKLKQIKAYGARIHRISGTRDDVAKAARESQGYYASHVLNPEFRDGIRSLAYEVADQLGYRMDCSIFLPVSAGTLLLGMISGLNHLIDSGEINEMPEIVAVQPESVSPLASRLLGIPFDPENTLPNVADALVSKKPPLLDLMVSRVGKNARGVVVNDNEIISAMNELHSSGYLVEPSSATVLAAYRKYRGKGKPVLILTGNGLKTLT